MRRGVVVLVWIATAAINFWLFQTLAIADRPSGSMVVTNAGVWRALFVMILFTMLVITIALVRSNFRNPGSKNWKVFWNVAELLWVVGAVFSLVAALQESDMRVRPEIVASMAADTSERRAALALEAEEVLFLACGRSTAGPACSMIDAARTPEGQRQANMFDVSHIAELARDRDAIPDDDVRARLFKLIDDWFIVGEGEALEKFEESPLELPNWMRAILLFAPHVLAFVFPLKLGRTLVAFRN